METLFPDEILWINGQSETDEARGPNIERAMVAFSDGSRLEMAACVKRPPLCEMESTFIEYIDPDTSKVGHDWDDGSTEAWDLSEKSTAFRILQSLWEIIRKMSEQPEEKRARRLRGWRSYS